VHPRRGSLRRRGDCAGLVLERGDRGELSLEHRFHHRQSRPAIDIGEAGINGFGRHWTLDGK